MKRSRFAEEQIIGMLREQEAGASVADVWRKTGISSATFCAWKSKYGGMDVSDVKRLGDAVDDAGRQFRVESRDRGLQPVGQDDIAERPASGRLGLGRGRMAGQIVEAEPREMVERSGLQIGFGREGHHATSRMCDRA